MENHFIAEKKTYKIEEDIVLDNGSSFGPIDVRYETYGQLNSDKTNAILICHAFSGDAHAAGYHDQTKTSVGWWNDMIGPGKPFDTNKYFIVCSNVLGGCSGTTGPTSINPKTGKMYGMTFPIITIHDMVLVQKKLVSFLGITKLLAIAGGSMGGMQVIDWALSYPEMAHASIILASTPRLSAQGIAFNAVGRNAIMSDPRWNKGNYSLDMPPARGLAIARMIGHITYLSDESMRMKFGRRLQDEEKYYLDFNDQFQVESYLQYNGDKFVDRFDANSYIYISKAMDYFDPEEKYGSLHEAFKRVQGRFLVMSFTSDWLFPPYQSKEMVFAMMKNDIDVSYTEIQSPYGHDAFLLEFERQSELITSFLESLT